MNELVKFSNQGGIGVITVDNPPVNALSPGVPEGILAAVKAAQTDDSIQALVLIGSGRTFIAGADIREFGKITSGERKDKFSLTELMLAMEDSSKPVICAIHGTAFGGGLEVAMGAHYRVAVASAQVGQPEVKLGLIPGAGGTQRLPRLAGVAKAVEMCAFGEPVKAPAALEAGIVSVENAIQFPFDQGCKKEMELFMKCLFSDQSKAMIHAFFGEREVAKLPFLPKDTPVHEIRKAAVVGAGTMGGGIAMNYVNAGIPVILKETTQEALDRGLATIRRNYANSVKKGRFPQSVMDQRMDLIRPQLTYDGFEEADIIAEAVFEGMALKKQVFAEIDRIAKPEAILASNTSTLNIDEIASATSRPQMVIGHHYFSPANVMRLIEIVRGKATSPEVIATSMALAKKLNKVGVLVGNCRGFVGNRMLHPYLREAEFLVKEGAAPEAVDRALYDFGMAMGPLAMGDLAGLD